jgi:outer membrane protein assembly factor BamA
MMRKSINHSCAIISFILTLMLLSSSALGQQGTKSLQLAKIEFEGLNRYSREQIIEASGLKIGQTVNETILDEAANRLMQTGFFKNMGYRVRAASDQATVTFQVEETGDKGVPVVFDNFVWFTDEELTAAIRREIPSFDGTALESGNITDSIKAILQRLLQEKKLPGQVEHMPSDAPSHIFSVKGVKIPICEVTFTGEAAINENDLKASSKALFNDDYSRGIVVDFANLSLGQLYRERGYLRARFREGSVKVLDNADCKSGVGVTLAVEEGLQYSWDKAEWAENKVLSGPELDAAMGMKQGEVASSTKIDKGMKMVDEAYGKKGYIAARLRPAPEFDDANKRVTYRFKVAEGPQFRMGAFLIKGLPDDLTKRFTDKWQLAQGAVYDASYLETYFSKVISGNRDLVPALGRVPKISSEVKPDSKQLMVNVTINFK